MLLYIENYGESTCPVVGGVTCPVVGVFNCGSMFISLNGVIERSCDTSPNRPNNDRGLAHSTALYQDGVCSGLGGTEVGLVVPMFRLARDSRKGGGRERVTPRLLVTGRGRDTTDVVTAGRTCTTHAS